MHKMIRRRSVETWRELVARQVRSGLSVQAFCQQERLNTWTFYGWRSRLRGRTATAETAAVGGSSGPEPTAGFIDLGALGGTHRSKAGDDPRSVIAGCKANILLPQSSLRADEQQVELV